MRVAAGGLSADVAVVGDYFLMPSALATAGGTAGLTLTLLGADGRPVAMVDRLTAPGSVAPIPVR